MQDADGKGQLRCQCGKILKKQILVEETSSIDQENNGSNARIFKSKHFDTGVVKIL